MTRPLKNNANYFSHDNNMRNDRKILALRAKYGHVGYSIWNMFLEMLTESDNFEIMLDEQEFLLLSGDFQLDVENLKEVVEFMVSIRLLQKNENIYFSNNLKERLDQVIKLRDKKRDWASKRWIKKSKTDLSTSKTELYPSETMQMKVKESKVNKSKVNNTSSNELVQTTSADPVNKVFNILYKVNPMINFGNKTQRKITEELIKQLGEDKVIKMTEYATKVFGEKYAPTITTPLELKNNMAKLAAYWKKQEVNNINGQDVSERRIL